MNTMVQQWQNRQLQDLRTRTPHPSHRLHSWMPRVEATPRKPFEVPDVVPGRISKGEPPDVVPGRTSKGEPPTQSEEPPASELEAPKLVLSSLGQ